MSVVMLNSPTPGQPAGTIDRLMTETLSLAEDAKAYLLNRPKKRPDAAPLPILAETAELSRVTARVGQCMAWLLARKAVGAGELSETESRADEWRLSDKHICEVIADHGVPLSPVLQQLSDRSLALYERISRLDQDLETRH